MVTCERRIAAEVTAGRQPRAAALPSRITGGTPGTAGAEREPS